MSKNTVFVASSTGWVQHGPVRKSDTQATSVARSLARRLGWVAIAADPESLPACPASAVPVGLAGLSPVWRDPVLAAQWAAGGRSPVAAAPVAPVAPVVESDKFETDRRLAAAGLVLG